MAGEGAVLKASPVLLVVVAACTVDKRVDRETE